MTVRKIAFTIIGAMILNSCQIMYIPPMQNVPMMEEKGEVKITGGYRDWQVAFSPANHLAVQVNGFYCKNQPIEFASLDQAFDYQRKSFSVDGALGMYRKIKDHQSFELFAGMGWGYADLTFRDQAVYGRRDGCVSNFTKVYLQSSYVISQNLPKGFLGFAFTGRITSVDFYHVKTVATGNTGSDAAVFFEPAATLKFGYKGVNAVLQTQLSRPFPIDYSRSYQRYGVYWLFSAGLEFQLTRIFGKKKQPPGIDTAPSL